METFKKLTVLILIIVISLMVFCGKHKDDKSIVGPDNPPDNLPEKNFGVKLIPSSQYSSIPIADLPAKGTLPAQYDISDNFPVAGNQGNQSSCVGWAVAYALKSYQEQIERKWGLVSQEHLTRQGFS